MATPNNSGLHSLATLIKRLEAAASRFEDIAEVLEHPANTEDRPETSSRGQKSDHRTSAPSYTPSPPTAGPTAAPAPTVTETPKIISAYQERVIDGKLKPFADYTKTFAPPSVVEAVSLVQKEFETLGSFLKIVAACQKPDQKTVESLLAPFPAAIEAVSRHKEANRRERDWVPHLTLLGEGAPAIGWVVSPKPITAISEIRDSVDFYGNRVKKEYKEKDPKHVEWVKLHTAILLELQAYIKDFHPAGLVWNPKGVTVDNYQASANAAPSAGGPPPPPPPPPPPAAAPPAASAAPAGGAAAVFAELNRGEEVTKGLRKVDKSEMTHKNPALRASSVVPASSSSPAVARKPTKPSKPSALAGKKPSKFVLDGNKWMIEYQENETVTVENAEISQSVNIFNCKGATILIKGKVNAVNILNSTKTSVLVQSVVSSISVTASPSFQLQVTGTAPMIQLDTTDSGQIYLSKDSLNAEITTAKCSAINISLPVPGEEDGIFEEQAVPEMFKTVVKDGKLVTTVVEHSG